MNAPASNLFSRLARKTETPRVFTDEKVGGERALALWNSYQSLGLGSIWISDCENRLAYFSGPSLMRLIPSGAFKGLALCDLFQTSAAEDQSVRRLQLALSRQTRFEKLTLQSEHAGQISWWSLSGEAQFDQAGQFCGFHGFCIDVTSERQAVEESSQLAMHDPLTGLLNRRRMTALLDRTLAAYRAQRRTCATMLIDLDRFKQVNDTLGHSTGDALLRQVGERLVAIVGDREKVCRIGGDEFQVILPDTEDRGDLGTLAERVIAMLSQPYTVDGSRCIIGGFNRSSQHLTNWRLRWGIEGKGQIDVGDRRYGPLAALVPRGVMNVSRSGFISRKD